MLLNNSGILGAKPTNFIYVCLGQDRLGELRIEKNKLENVKLVEFGRLGHGRLVWKARFLPHNYF